MVFAPPSNLKDLVLYWWKIIDCPSIQVDNLTNFIAFDLKLFSINNTKKIITESIKRKFLIEIPEKEEVKLSPPMEKEFEAWQKQGIVKLKKINKILSVKWRMPMEIDLLFLFKVYRMELIDPPVWNEAYTISSTRISFDEIDFSNRIMGKIKGSDQKEGDFSFIIDIKNKRIIHDCPLFREVYHKNGRFCAHLARVIMKLFADSKENTVKLLESIAENRPAFNDDLGFKFQKEHEIFKEKSVWEFLVADNA